MCKQKRFGHTILSLLFMLMIALLAKGAYAEMDSKAILTAADQARGNVAGLEWIIQLKSIESGRTQNRTLQIKARDKNSLATFLAPARVKGRMLLMLDRNMWFVKPGLRKPVPISPRQKLSGGAANGDIASTNYAGDYEAQYVSEDLAGNVDCYLFDLLSNNRKATYDRIRYWISKDQNLGVKAEFYTVSGKLLKTALFEYDNILHTGAKKRPFISKMVITDALIPLDITTMTYSDVMVKEIPDSAFNLNLLRR
jgi:hypothetical protein